MYIAIFYENTFCILYSRKVEREEDCVGLIMFLGIVQILQDRYQKGRLYALIATGKVGYLDVEGGEHAGSWATHVFTPTLAFLLPCILAFQVRGKKRLAVFV